MIWITSCLDSWEVLHTFPLSSMIKASTLQSSSMSTSIISWEITCTKFEILEIKCNEVYDIQESNHSGENKPKNMKKKNKKAGWYFEGKLKTSKIKSHVSCLITHSLLVWIKEIRAGDTRIWTGESYITYYFYFSVCSKDPKASKHSTLIACMPVNTKKSGYTGIMSS